MVSSITALVSTCRTAEGDEYYTPCYAVAPLMKYLDKSKVIYEAASNHSSLLVDCLQTNGFTVITSGGRDFLKDELPEFDMVITNPPYSIKDKFIERCYELNKPFALLLPITTLQGNKRGQWFMDKGLELLVLNQRVNFVGGGSSPHFGVAWFCKGILPEKLIFTNIQKEG